MSKIEIPTFKEYVEKQKSDFSAIIVKHFPFGPVMLDTEAQQKRTEIRTAAEDMIICIDNCMNEIKAERAKSEQLACDFAEWVQAELWVRLPNGIWWQKYTPNRCQTTAQLFTLYQNDKMK